MMDALHARGVKPRILGGGTNLLIDDGGIRGPVVSTEALREIRFLAGGRVHADAGVPLGALLRRTAGRGLAGLEGLSGIPGTVGGAVCMNAGGGAHAIGDRVASVDAVEPGRGLVRIPGERIRFGYRRSGLSRLLVVSAVFQLQADDPAAVRDRARTALERKRATQPLGQRSAGCFFRNVGRIPAGLLIDRAGLKGFRIGGAMVSPVHANFIVNVGGASSRDVLKLADFVRGTVWEIYGVRLRSEVRFWKSAPAPAQARDARAPARMRRRSARSARRRPVAAQLGGGA
jgi:UDP-N-acetylmuramate dehydrogenase